MAYIQNWSDILNKQVYIYNIDKKVGAAIDSSDNNTFRIANIYNDNNPIYIARLHSIISQHIWNKRQSYPVIQLLSQLGRSGMSDINIYNQLRSKFGGLIKTIATTTQLNRGDKKAVSLIKLMPREIINSTKRYLDYGCLDGEITVAIGAALKLPVANVVGVDIDRYYSKKVAKLMKFVQIDKQFNAIKKENEKVIGGDAYGSYDLITMLMVLHHIDPADYYIVLDKISKLLKRGGYLVIKEHNIDEHQHIYVDIINLQHEFFNNVWSSSPQSGRDEWSATYRPVTGWDKILSQYGLMPINIQPPINDNLKYNPFNKYTRIYVKK